MKLLHCANLHLDATVTLNPIDAIDRHRELLDTFRRMIQCGVDEQVTAILLVGGLFATPLQEHKSTKEQVLSLIEQHAQIDFIYVQGTSPSLSVDSDFFTSLSELPKNLKLFSSTTWTSYRYDDVTISSILLGKDTPPQYWEQLQLSAQDVNIVALYGSLSPVDTNPLSHVVLSDYSEKHINYLALGQSDDYHVEPLDIRGICASSGCLEGRTFDHCGKKGFLLLDIFQKTIYHDFMSVSKRKFHQLDVDISSCSSEMDVMFSIESAISPLSEQDFVTLTLTGTINETTYLDMGFLTSNFSSRFYLWKLINNTSIVVDYASYQLDISLKGEFVRMVQESSLSDLEKGQIISRGLRAIQGKEVFT